MQALISQGDVTIPHDVVPVIACSHRYFPNPKELAQLVNFLRCGVGTVQLILESGGNNALASGTPIRDSLASTLTCLAFAGERFSVRVREPSLGTFFAEVSRAVS